MWWRVRGMMMMMMMIWLVGWREGGPERGYSVE
jgi:hypothetical protein